MQRIIQIENTLDLTVNTAQVELKGYIKKFTKIILGTFRKALLFITKTIIRQIIRQKTWYSCLQKNTSNITLTSTIPTQIGLKKDLPNIKELVCSKGLTHGKTQKKESLFLNFMHKKTSLQKSSETLSVKSVEKNVKQDTNEVENIVAKNVAQNGITESTGKKQKVYNLTIEDTPEYFANGVLVHNCWESTTGTDHFVFADLYSYLAMLSGGTGQFFPDGKEKEYEFIGRDNKVGDWGKLMKFKEKYANED